MARITLECPRCRERTVVKQLAEDDLDALECPKCEVGLRRVKADSEPKPKLAKKKPRPLVLWLIFGALLVGGPGAVAAVWWFNKKNEPVPAPGPVPDFKAPEPVNLHPVINPDPTPQTVKPVAGAPELAQTIWLLTNDNGDTQLAGLADRVKKRGGVRMNHVNDKLHDELLRQSWWLIATHDFGLRVGDENLHEPPPDALPAELQFRIRGDYMVTQIIDKKMMNATWDVFGWALLQGPKDGERKFWEGTHLYNFAGDEKPAQRVEEAEAQARGVLQKSLKAAGFEPRTVKLSEAAAPAGLEKLLDSLQPTDAFAAVRSAHAEMAAGQGESPALLSALARGYAQLGLLTNHHWTAHPAVFKARALLYAQRLVARTPRSPAALWLRAYVAALAGKHAMALADLQAAGDLAANAPSPAWVAPLDAYLHFDAARLAAVPDPTPLVRLLRFLVVEAPHSEIGVHPALRAGAEYLTFHPDGYRVHDSLCRTGSPAQVDAATQAGLKAFAENVRGRLRAVPGLPQKVRDRLADSPADVFAALREADGGTPSWAMLADVVQGDYYALAWHRLDYLSHTLSTRTTDVAPELLEPLAGHPLLPLIEAFRFDPREDGFKVYQKLSTVKPYRIDMPCVGYGHLLQKVAVDEFQEWDDGVRWRTDGTYESEVFLSRLQYKGNSRGTWAASIEAASPHAPYGVGQRIERGQPADVAKFAEFERAYPADPHVLYALGDHHARGPRPADAVRYWTRCLAASPDWAVYQCLAKLHTDTANHAAWAATLAAALKEPHLAAYHAEARRELARGHMARQQYDLAEPFAVAAAVSGTAEALIVAAECELQLKKWPEAERYFRTAALKHPETAFDWYTACRRTGRLNVAAAERAVGEYIPELQGRTPQPKVMKLAHYYLMARQPNRADSEYRRANTEHTATDVSVLFATMLADSRGDRAGRDEAQKWMGQARFRPAGPGVLLLPLYDEWFQIKNPPTEAELAKALAALEGRARPDADFFAGWYLYNRGQTDRATAHWTAFLANPAGTLVYQAHATCFLEQLRENGTIAFGKKE